ncbi:hypothetical protein COT47_01755 [Candidatus Woesearchaeota archaeon CG08_land_8_20_14_0_20_43_7]|nr:MAG: hypothetical protein COT47_01755 [Candidatus Woesearchaeota archaeon CG08_land_8_20_14_0_20_43_7]
MEKSLSKLNENFHRISAAKELYDLLKIKYSRVLSAKEKEKIEGMRLRLLYAKETLLKLTMENKEILETIEKKGI